jgi:hypothetical protein
MARKDGATIQDFQGVDGFNIPSMTALKIAERHGYKTSAVKKPGERTVYKAVRLPQCERLIRTRDYLEAQSGRRDGC